VESLSYFDVYVGTGGGELEELGGKSETGGLVQISLNDLPKTGEGPVATACMCEQNQLPKYLKF
jgi:hypothetical protein